MEGSAVVKGLVATIATALNADPPTYDSSYLARADERGVSIHPVLDKSFDRTTVQRIITLALVWSKYWRLIGWTSWPSSGERQKAPPELKASGSDISALASSAWASGDWLTATAISAAEWIRREFETSDAKPRPVPLLSTLEGIERAITLTKSATFPSLPPVANTFTLTLGWETVPASSPDGLLVVRTFQRTLTVGRIARPEDAMPKSVKWWTEPTLIHEAARKGTLQHDDVICKAAVGAEPIPNTRRVKFVLSTGDVDRDQDLVSPDGWEIDNYKKNPVVMWSHDYSQLPLGKTVDLGFENGRLVGTVDFATKEMNPLAESVYQMVLAKILNGGSVGFKPKDYKYDEARKGINFHKQELLEFSIVAIPSNPNALSAVEVGKGLISKALAAGIDVKPLLLWAGKTMSAIRKAAEQYPQMPNMGVQDNANCEYGHLCPKKEKMACPLAEACPAGKASRVAITKRGRVLSAANEAKLRTALDEVQSILALLQQPNGNGNGNGSGDDKAAARIVAKRIVERDGQFCVVSEDGSETLGCHDTREEAVDQLRAVEANKAVLTNDMPPDPDAAPPVPRIVEQYCLTDGGEMLDCFPTLDEAIEALRTLEGNKALATTDVPGNDLPPEPPEPPAGPMIVERDGQFCVVDGEETLGCYDSREEAAASMKMARHPSVKITAQQMSKLCPECATKMRVLGLTAIKLTPDVIAKAPEITAKLCDYLNEHKAADCMDLVADWDLKSPEGFCKALKSLCASASDIVFKLHDDNVEDGFAIEGITSIDDLRREIAINVAKGIKLQLTGKVD